MSNKKKAKEVVEHIHVTLPVKSIRKEIFVPAVNLHAEKDMHEFIRLRVEAMSAEILINAQKFITVSQIEINKNGVPGTHFIAELIVGDRRESLQLTQEEVNKLKLEGTIHGNGSAGSKLIIAH